MIEPLQWIFAAERLPDADMRVLLWLQAPDGSQDWDVGHLDADDGWVLDWCGAAPALQVLAWAEPAGPDAIAALRGSGCDVLDDLNAAAAAKWRGNPSAQRAGLFARAADEVSRLRAALDRAALALEGARAA